MKVYSLDRVQKDLGHSRQAQYLFNYVRDLKAKTVILEEQYFDKDYVVDYSKFYARSFTTHERFTKRLHFFSHSFSQKEFREVLENNNMQLSHIVRESYLGFVVVKPLVDARGNPLIGRTILKPYSPCTEQDSCNFVEGEYSASLYGIPLHVKSLPFQVQDIAVGACSTVALWVSLHPLYDLFGVPMQSPAEITERSASFPIEYRSFPSSGLTREQMIVYIRSTGLDIESIDIESKIESEIGECIVPDVIRAYIKAGLPIIATVELEKMKNTYCHAVVISGYRCDQTGVIKELYVHDDQIGPYNPVVSDEGFIEWKNRCVLKYDRKIVEKLLVPVYPKIRLTFGRIYEVYLRERKGSLSKEFSTELYLTQVGAYKEFLRNHFIQDKVKILTTSLPRFLWIIWFHLNGTPVIDDVYDGTSVFPKRLLTVRFHDK